MLGSSYDVCIKSFLDPFHPVPAGLAYPTLGLSLCKGPGETRQLHRHDISLAYNWDIFLHEWQQLALILLKSSLDQKAWDR